MRQILSIFKSLAIFVFISLGLNSCIPGGPDYADEVDLTIAIENTAIDYSDYQTYVLADTIVYIADGEQEELSKERERLIKSNIRSELNRYGWTEETDPQNNGSDVLVAVSILENTSVDIVNGAWWGYWGGWGGWGYYPPYPGGGYYPAYPGYPGYCCYTDIYAYTTGTLIIEMVDPNNAEDIEGEIDRIPIVWAGALNGLLEGSDRNIDSRIQNGIKQIFEKSPYLNK